MDCNNIAAKPILTYGLRPFGPRNFSDEFKGFNRGIEELGSLKVYLQLELLATEIPYLVLRQLKADTNTLPLEVVEIC